MAVNVGRLTDEEQMSVKMWFYKSTKKKKKTWMKHVRNEEILLGKWKGKGHIYL